MVTGDMGPGTKVDTQAAMWGIHNDTLAASELVEKGFVSIGWDEVGDISLIGDDLGALRAVLESVYPAAPDDSGSDEATEGMATASAVASRLGLRVEETATWPGRGKKIPLEGGHTLYVNTSHCEVRADPEMVADWIAQGLGTGRGKSNYLRVAVPTAKPGSYASWSGTLRRFAFEVAVGDIVVAPSREDRTVNFGRVLSPYEFHADEPTHRHRRRVEWIATGVSRDDLSLTAQNEISAAISVFRIRRHVKELVERIRAANVTANAHAFAAYAIADRVRRAAVNEGSLFTPDTAIWSLEHLDELITNFVDAADSSAASFGEKLDHQLVGVSDGALQLFAELWFLSLVPLADYTPATKRKLLSSLLERMAVPASIPDDLDDALESAAFAGGVAFKTRRWAQLGLLIRIADGLLRLGVSERERALGDPYAFAEFLGTVTRPKEPAQRQALKFILFPDYFLPIVSRAHRRAIVAAFADRIDGAYGRDDDETLHLIVEALRRELGKAPEFYGTPLVDEWDPDRTFVRSPGGAASDSVRRAWLVRTASDEQRRRGFAEDYVALEAEFLEGIGPGSTREDVVEAVEAGYGHVSAAARTERIDAFHIFLNRMKPGDLVAVVSSGSLRVGDIEGAAQVVLSEGGTTELRRAVTWSDVAVDADSLPRELAARLQVDHEVMDLTGQLEVLDSLKESSADAALAKVVLPDATPELAAALHVAPTWIQEIIELLRDRPQLIFYGPPGTGKTYLARKIAAHLTGDPALVKLVQFHPAYSYEDFFQGYRPTEAGTFQLVSGPMRRIVDQAREHPGTPHVLIIDEINRGNLAKVFGELYFLLEYREEAVDLMYGGDDKGFTLPENVFIIGTMNTADRSIALVDTAMRRRFAFLPLHPSEEPTSGILRSWLNKVGLPDETANLLDELNRRIDDPDFKVGPSYFMREAVHVDGGLERTWRTAILPLLEEHHFGDGTDVTTRYGLPEIRKAATDVGSISEPEPDESASE